MKITAQTLRRLIRQSLNEARVGNPRIKATKRDLRPDMADIAIEKVDPTKIDHDRLTGCVNEILFKTDYGSEYGNAITKEFVFANRSGGDIVAETIEFKELNTGDTLYGIPIEELIIPARGTDIKFAQIVTGKQILL